MLDDPGDEVPSPGCGCMLSVNKPVVLTSSGGAGSTVIDATRVPSLTNVLIILDGGEFGRAGKGFTVTGTSSPSGNGIKIDSANLKVRGNQIVAVDPGNEGIEALFGGPILIEGNQLLGDWGVGIETLGIHGHSYGITLAGSESRPFTGAIQLNNFVGNSACAVINDDFPNVDAKNNYWGAATGPGPGSADEVCNSGDGTTIVTPFATKPFSVKAPLKP